MGKVFLIVPTGLNVHVDVDVGIVRKLDLEKLRFFLRRDDVHHMYVWDRRPVTQLPFLALSILQPIGRLEGSTHFGVLSESVLNRSFLKEDFGGTCRNPAA